MRWLEIDEGGRAFHEPSSDHPFSVGVSKPPTEVVFCDCAGAGRICHHTYPNGHEIEVVGNIIKGMVTHPDDMEEPDVEKRRLVPQVSQADFKLKHGGKRCAHRRQIFVDVTDRPEAQLGMLYDEKTDTFSDAPAPKPKTKKV